MKVYEGKDIRNLVVIGHSHSGKTSLVSSMLYTGGATPKLGRVDDGSTVTDHDEEEISRQMTISTAIASLEWHNTKINLFDSPGFTMFAHEARIAMSAAEAALVVVDGVSGVEVVTEKVWQYAEEINLPRVICVSRMDRERANYESAMASLVSAFGRQVVPVQIPIGSEKSLKGVVDLVTMKAYTYEMGGSGKGKEGPIPAELEAAAKEAHERLVEIVAEGKDELMEEFFEKGTIAEEHLIPALHEAIKDDKIFPVLFASGLGNIGTDHLMDFVVDYFPTAAEHAAVHAEPASAGNGHGVDLQVSDASPTSIYVFKTANDPFAGRITFFKVFSGVVKNDATLQNFIRGTSEKLAHLSIPQGKNLVAVPELHAGRRTPTVCGRAYGARDRTGFAGAVRLVIVWGFAFSLAVTAVFALFGPYLIDMMTASAEVRHAARNFLLYVILAPLLAVFAFAYDGIYIGATWARDMRNLMVLSLGIFLAAWLALRSYGNAGLWGGLLVHYAARGGLQALRYPALFKASFPATATPPASPRP